MTKGGYQLETILPPLTGTGKFGGTQSRIIMGGVNVQNTGTNHIPSMEFVIDGGKVQYGLQVSDVGEAVITRTEPNTEVYEVENMYSFLSDINHPEHDIIITGVTPDLHWDEETGILSGVEWADYIPGMGYRIVDIIKKESYTLYIYEEVQAGRNIREVYEILASNKEDKGRLAMAITAKGVPTPSTAALDQMADNVLAIPQQLNTKESDFGSFVVPSEYMWNVFEIARDLQKDNPHPDMAAFFVAEYYRGFDSLVLTGAHAYMTCDGDYYAPMDKAAEITHVWHDADNGKANRYVIFYYMLDGYTFSNATAALCPRRVALSGRCSSFIVTGENRLTDVYVLGELGHFEGGTTGNTWNPAQVIRNYQEHASGYIYGGTTSIISSFLSELEAITGGTLFNQANSLITLSLPNVIRISKTGTDSVFFRQYDRIVMSSFIELYAPKLQSIDARLFYTSSSNDCYTALKRLDFPELLTIGANGRILYSSYVPSSFKALTTLYMPKLTTCSGWILEGIAGYPYCYSLEDVEVGEMVTSLNMRYWNPTNVIAAPEKLAILNENIRNHIAAKVSDRTGMSALTFTVSTNLYNNLEQATLDAFTVKNWNVAGV